MASRVRNYLKYYVPWITVWFMYNNYNLTINKEPSFNINFFGEAVAPSVFGELLAHRTYLMDLELELIKLIEEQHPIYLSVLPKLVNVSRELENTVEDVHNFTSKYDKASTSESEIECFRKATWNSIQKIDKYLDMTLEFENLRMRQLDDISDRVRDVVRSAKCGAQFPQMLAIFPRLDGYDWNQEAMNRVTTVLNDTWTDGSIIQDLLAMYEERCGYRPIFIPPIPEINKWQHNALCCAHWNSTDWKDDIYELFYENRAELELYDYNIQRSIFRINSLMNRLSEKEHWIWDKEVLPLVHNMQMTTKIGFEPLWSSRE